jgi:hypothetical protein
MVWVFAPRSLPWCTFVVMILSRVAALLNKATENEIAVW